MKRTYKMKQIVLVAFATLTCLHTSAQLPDIGMAKGKFDNNWQSLEQWECPEWFQDAKFGLWAHWGPQCQANSGDWFGRYMYGEETYYDYQRGASFKSSEYGFKEFCRDWKAEKWDPEAIIAKYEKVGAKYFLALANHHDNFDCWDSPYQEWNSVNMGPKRDLGGEWAQAARKHGMKFGMSVHADHAWTWFEIGRKWGDVRLTKADGKGKWWEGYDPNELYAQAHETVSSGWDNMGNIHSQWNWVNGASIPDEAYKTKLQNRCRQMINHLQPDMIYFDDTVLPFYGCDNQWGQDFLAYYYNYMSGLNGGGDPNVVCCGKVLPDYQKEVMLWDVERGIPDRPQKKPWQTDTCIGGWHYSLPDYWNGAYKSAATVVRMLIDIVSKNGNLALSVPLRGDGSYDEKEAAVLDGIQAWMEINGESIYGTRVWWDCFGEGPLAEASNALNGQGFNEGQNYSNEDVRYVTSKDGSIIYATIMAWPEAGEFTMKAFSPLKASFHGLVESVYLLGYGEVPFKLGAQGLVIDVPGKHPNEIAPAFRITFKEGSLSDAQVLQMLIEGLDQLGDEAKQNSSYTNSGKYNTIKVNKLIEAVEKAKAADMNNAADVKAAKEALAKAYQDFENNGQNQSGAWTGKYESDQTTSVLVQGSGFARSAGGTARFGKPKNWTVENFSIPNGGDGTKQGLDNYSGKDALMLGVWNDRDSNQKGDLSNARIYRKVKLEKGLYYFGAGFNANYGLSNQAYMFVSTELCDTKDIPTKSLAYYNINKVSTDLKVHGLWVSIPKDIEVYIGFQVNLKDGSATQEFRAEKVVFYRLPEITADNLTKLTTDVSKKLTSFSSKTKYYNTGFYDPDKLAVMQTMVSDVEASVAQMTDAEIEIAYYELEEAWTVYQEEGLNHWGLLTEESQEDLTVNKLTEASMFSRKDPSVTTRFAAPLYWTVQNFKIPNGSEGIKQGLDNYSGQDALMLGIWDDRGNNQSGNLTNARIYQTLTLEPGFYYFGASFNAIHQLNAAYMYVADKTYSTSLVPKHAMAYLSISDCAISEDTYGIYFRIEEEQEVVLCFQANLSAGATQQEFRAETVSLQRLDTPTAILAPAASTIRSAHKGIYGMDGIRRNEMQKGINIVNGKLILK